MAKLILGLLENTLKLVHFATGKAVGKLEGSKNSKHSKAIANCTTVNVNCKQSLKLPWRRDDVSSRLLREIKRSNIVPETQKVLERLSAVEKYYNGIESEKSRKMEELESKKSSLREKEKELNSSKLQEMKATCDIKEASRSKKANIAGAVIAGVLAVPTAGLAIPAAILFGSKAVKASGEEKQAESDRIRAEVEIRQCKKDISQHTKHIDDLKLEIAEISGRLREIGNERAKIHEYIADITTYVTTFELALRYWENIQDPSCRSPLQPPSYRMLEDAHHKMKTTLGNRNEQFLDVPFDCSRCKRPRKEFPHVHGERLVCGNCF